MTWFNINKQTTALILIKPAIRKCHFASTNIIKHLLTCNHNFYNENNFTMIWLLWYDYWINFLGQQQQLFYLKIIKILLVLSLTRYSNTTNRSNLNSLVILNTVTHKFCQCCIKLWSLIKTDYVCASRASQLLVDLSPSPSSVMFTLSQIITKIMLSSLRQLFRKRSNNS